MEQDYRVRPNAFQQERKRREICKLILTMFVFLTFVVIGAKTTNHIFNSNIYQL